LNPHRKLHNRRLLRNSLMASTILVLLASGGIRPTFAHTHHGVTRTDQHARPTMPRDHYKKPHVRDQLFASLMPAGGRSGRDGPPFEGTGIASVYSGHHTASGEQMNFGAMTAAHRTLPFGTKVTVVNHRNGKSAVVRINDRGPFVHGRVIDLSPAAGRVLGIDGISMVSLITQPKAHRPGWLDPSRQHL
jgi:rare lipoprotein A